MVIRREATFLFAGGWHRRAVSGCPLWVISGHLREDQRCPLYPQKQTCSSSASMSAKCQKRTRGCFELTQKVPTIVTESRSISPEIEVELAWLIPRGVTHHTITRNRQIERQTKHAVAHGNFRRRQAEE